MKNIIGTVTVNPISAAQVQASKTIAVPADILAAFNAAREQREAEAAKKKAAEKAAKRASKVKATASNGEKRSPGRPKTVRKVETKEEKSEKVERKLSAIVLPPIPEKAMSVESFLILSAKGHVGEVNYSALDIFTEACAILKDNKEFSHVRPCVAQGILSFANGVDIARRILQAKKAVQFTSIEELRRQGKVQEITFQGERASLEAFRMAKEQAKAFGVKEYDPKTEVLDAIVCKSNHAGMMPGVDSDARAGHNYKTAQDALVRLMSKR